MSKKKTPQEKKKVAYEKDHYTFAWSSPHGFRKTWQKKKSHVNRVIRRKSKNLLHEVEKFPYEKLSPEGESLTAELFRRGLSRQKLGKVDRPKQGPPEILLEPEWQFRITPCVFRIQRKTIDGSTASALAFTSFL
jgi:hypothetical protein